MKKTFTFIHRVLKIPELIHEILHYIPAWYFGLNPRISPDWYSMKHKRTTNGKNMIILLMPAFVGLLLFPLVLNMAINKTMFSIAAGIFWIGWMVACGKDLYQAGYFILFKKWHSREENIQ